MAGELSRDRHGLRLGDSGGGTALQRDLSQFRKAIEASVDADGGMSLEALAGVQTCVRFERTVRQLEHLLRDRKDTLTAAEVVKTHNTIVQVSLQRDAALARLGLSPQEVVSDWAWDSGADESDQEAQS